MDKSTSEEIKFSENSENKATPGDRLVPNILAPDQSKHASKHASENEVPSETRFTGTWVKGAGCEMGAKKVPLEVQPPIVQGKFFSNLNLYRFAQNGNCVCGGKFERIYCAPKSQFFIHRCDRCEEEIVTGANGIIVFSLCTPEFAKKAQALALPVEEIFLQNGKRIEIKSLALPAPLIDIVDIEGAVQKRVQKMLEGGEGDGR